MQWVDALQEVRVLESSGTICDVVGVEYDSRRVTKGSVFVAMQGETTDGNRYIDSAIAQGASAILTDSGGAYAKLRREHPEICAAWVAHGRRALSEISAALLRHPERTLSLSAVTGTNGKTTTAYLLEQMLRIAGRSTVLIGTIATRVAGEVRESHHTTPESRDTLHIFADGVAAGATEAVMEMSSHALEQERVWGLPVDVAIFTNLTQDHLDYHRTMSSYAAAKQRIFHGVGTQPPRIAVINMDSDYTGRMEDAASGCGQIWTYGTKSASGWTPQYRATNIQFTLEGTTFDWETGTSTVELKYPLVGEVNVSNMLAASCAALARGLTTSQIAAAALRLCQVPGRFQVVAGSSAAGFSVVVDYAHTEDALRNLVRLARRLANARNGRVITLFGCGGDRDRTKRPRMGLVAGEGSDLVVLTSDNPRSEDPLTIIEEALAGVRQTSTKCVVEPDRALAIASAIKSARENDVVLLAGKATRRCRFFETDRRRSTTYKLPSKS
jgi:UDP-N-acetylmuramoyl-L-alanyl-D-glutamate--2,6-diaminopimelate ligase